MKTRYEKVKFFRRRQFILGPDYIHYEEWHKIKIDDYHFITVHPDLRFTQLEENKNKAILLGYFLDPLSPESTDKDILSRFLDKRISVENTILKLENLCGRFVLIIKSHDNLWLFHDACGLRQVHYCSDKSKNIWVASQPGLLAQLLGFNYDEEMISYRNLSIFVSGRDEFWFPHTRTPFKEVKYLLPNHYLDLSTGEVYRFWPKKGSFENLAFDECLDLTADLLKNTIKAATMRFDVKMGISAGCDSRKSLAAAREVKNKICFFTHTPNKGSEADMEIPSRLLPKLGLEHNKIRLEQMDNGFRYYYELNNTWPRERHGNIAYSIMKYFGTEAVILNSNISEYSGIWYWLPKNKITAKNLAMLRLLKNHMVIREFDKWLNGAALSCESAKMNVLVLFDLELRSRWVSQALAEYDIAFETFNPYNNRYLFRLELSVNERIRQGRSLYMPKKLIEKMWPEALLLPINPEKHIIGKMKKVLNNRVFFPIIRNIRYLRAKWIFSRLSS